MSLLEWSIHKNVAAMYNRFPYPAYPLFFKLKWWESYQSPAAFSRRLALEKGYPLAPIKRILLAGCGDTQPYSHRTLKDP